MPVLLTLLAVVMIVMVDVIRVTLTVDRYHRLIGVRASDYLWTAIKWLARAAAPGTGARRGRRGRHRDELVPVCLGRLCLGRLVVDLPRMARGGHVVGYGPAGRRVRPRLLRRVHAVHAGNGEF
jgi:hypothetical protein